MIILREMKTEEYNNYKKYFIDDYSREIADNYGHSLKESIIMAEETLKEGLPEGVFTPDNYMISIESTKEENKPVIGYLWYKLQESDKSVFIYDFYIFEKYRAKGYGKSSIKALENKLEKSSIKNIKLRVAYKNKSALELYKKSGFEITGYNMIKKI